MNKTIALLFLLSGCQYLGIPSPVPAPKASSKFQCTSRCIAPDKYEVSLNGEPGVASDELKAALKSEGTELCANKVYLLRGLREEVDEKDSREMLLGHVDCVGLDYFSGEAGAATKGQLSPSAGGSKQ